MMEEGQFGVKRNFTDRTRWLRSASLLVVELFQQDAHVQEDSGGKRAETGFWYAGAVNQSSVPAVEQKSINCC